LAGKIILTGFSVPGLLTRFSVPPDLTGHSAHLKNPGYNAAQLPLTLRRRVQAGLNKGEARNAPARAVFFNRLGEIRDRGFEQ
jgi:hypothetical protein